MIGWFKGLSIGMKILSGASPLIVLAAAWGYGAWQYHQGVKSQSGVIEQLTADKAALAADLTDCADERNDLLRQAEAREKETAAAMRAQAEAFNTALALNRDAISALSRGRVDLNKLFETLKEDAANVTTEIVDGRCIVRGSGELLRRAAAGEDKN